MFLHRLRPFLLALAVSAGPALLAGKLPLTNALIPWSVMIEMGYPNPSQDARGVMPYRIGVLLREGNATPKEAQELLKAPLVTRLGDEIAARPHSQYVIYQAQVDLLNESFALGEVEDGSAGAARRAEIEARLEQLESELEQAMRGELLADEKRLVQLRKVKDALQLAFEAAADSLDRRPRALGQLRAAEQRLWLAERNQEALARMVAEAPWQDWRDGFGFQAPPEGLVLCLPGSWRASMAEGATAIGTHRSRAGEPDSLIRLRMLRGIREKKDQVAFGLAELGARKQREVAQAARASTERAEAAAKKDAERIERARRRAEDNESKLEALTQSVRDLETDTSRQEQAAAAEALEWVFEQERMENAAESKRKLRDIARTASPWSEAPSTPAPADPSSSSSSEPLSVNWHEEARVYDLNKQVKDSTTRGIIETAVGMLRTGRLLGTAVAGAPGIYELRPNGGQSTWRPLYVRHGERFVIVALTREAMENPAKFAAGVKRAQRRAAALPPPPHV